MTVPKVIDAAISGNNPVETIARKSFGLPKTAKGLLATFLNPRPAGIVIRMTCPFDKRLSELMSDEEWANEIRHNNGNYIAVLLRHPSFASDSDFVDLFASVEVEYRATLKRSKWALFQATRFTRPETIFEHMRSSLKGLIDGFVTWSLKNRRKVVTALHEMETDGRFQSGSAMSDLARTGMDW